jgi:hypothetical protein
MRKTVLVRILLGNDQLEDRGSVNIIFKYNIWKEGVRLGAECNCVGFIFCGLLLVNGVESSVSGAQEFCSNSPFLLAFMPLEAVPSHIININMAAVWISHVGAQIYNSEIVLKNNILKNK